MMSIEWGFKMPISSVNSGTSRVATLKPLGGIQKVSGESSSTGAHAIKAAVKSEDPKSQSTASEKKDDSGDIAKEIKNLVEKEFKDLSDKEKDKIVKTIVDKFKDTAQVPTKEDLKAAVAEQKSGAWSEQGATSGQSNLLKPGETQRLIREGSGGNASGGDSQQQNNGGAVQDKLNNLKSDQQIRNPDSGETVNGTGNNSSRMDEARGLQIPSDPESAGKRFGLDTDVKSGASASDQSAQPIPGIQGPGGAGGIGNANGLGSFVNNGIINNGQLAMGGGVVDNGSSQQINNNLEQNIQPEVNEQPEQAPEDFHADVL